MDKQKITTETHKRQISLKREDINAENRTVNIAFSSEMPVERYFGNEVLDHNPESVDLTRLNDSAPLLLDHDPEKQIGVIESAKIDSDKRGRAVVRFSKSALGQEIFEDIQDGIRKHVSVGYRIHELVENKDTDEIRITDWRPFEVSIVSIPADHSVGVNRNLSDKKEHIQMTDKTNVDAGTTEKPDFTKELNAMRQAETDRVNELNKLGAKHKATDLSAKFIAEGRSVSEFNAELVDVISKRANEKAEVVIKEPAKRADSADIGMTDKEVGQFSFVRAITALANPTDRRAQENASFEFECSRSASEKAGKDSQGIMIPMDVLKRDLTVGTATAGGHTVATDLLANNFIDMLRNNTVVFNRARQLTNLVGNVAIPRMTGGATAYWVGESASPTESQQAFDQVTLSPNTVGAYTDISRKLMLQSSMDVEGLVREDLARTLGIEIDRACINGSGASNQPTGILNTSGIGAVAGGTNGLAPTYAHMVDLESELAIDNADIGNLVYITNSAVRGKLKQTEKASGTAQFVFDNGRINGYEALITNQVPSDLDKGTSTGVCSAIIFANLADLIVGMWGGLDLTIDTSTGSTSGTVRVVALQDMDVAVRHAESFSAMQDALTA